MWTSGDSIGGGIVTFFVMCCIACAAVGALLMWLVPMLWGWIKPIIHQVTA